MHFYSVEEDADSDYAIADRPAVVAGVCIIAVGLVAEVVLVGFEQPMRSEVVLDAVLLVVVDYAYYVVQLALDSP